MKSVYCYHPTVVSSRAKWNMNDRARQAHLNNIWKNFNRQIILEQMMVNMNRLYKILATFMVGDIIGLKTIIVIRRKFSFNTWFSEVKKHALAEALHLGARENDKTDYICEDFLVEKTFVYIHLQKTIYDCFFIVFP